MSVPKISLMNNLNANNTSSNKQLTYWIKYAGIVDGTMGILTRKESVMRTIETKKRKRNSLKIILSKKIIERKKIKQEDIKEYVSIKKHSLVKVPLALKLNLVGDNLKQVELLNRTISYNTKQLLPSLSSSKRHTSIKKINSEDKHLPNNYNFSTKKYRQENMMNAWHKGFRNANYNPPYEQVTGFPNPNRYKGHITTNYMHSKKLRKIQKPLRSSSGIMNANNNLLIKTAKAKLFSELVFTNRRLQKKLRTHLWVPIFHKERRFDKKEKTLELIENAMNLSKTKNLQLTKRKDNLLYTKTEQLHMQSKMKDMIQQLNNEDSIDELLCDERQLSPYTNL